MIELAIVAFGALAIRIVSREAAGAEAFLALRSARGVALRRLGGPRSGNLDI